MRNKVLKKLLMIAMAVTMISGTSIATVYANANPPAEETTTQVVEETATESTEDTEKKEDTGRVTGEGDNSAFSTPGNAQLVDDKENDDTKQFLTIQTKKGNTFYMVIDRSSNTENVYMMSLVDENDLAEFLDETEKSKETEESTVVIPETTPETTPVAEEETGVKKEEKTGEQIFRNMNFVITGSVEHFANRAQAKEFIESLGGKVTGSVTSKTNYLINNDTTSNSSKNKKAKELGIPILSEEDFLKMAQQ